MFRQGDVLLIPIEGAMSIRPGKGRHYVSRKTGEGIILAAGEATGHHHRVRSTRARLVRPGAFVGGTRVAERVLVVPKGGAELTHEEHDTIKLPEGKYRVVGQREFAPPPPKERKRAEAQPERFTRPVWD